MPGFVQQRVVEIGREHLERGHPGRLLGGLDKRHGDRIRLLARGTAGHPGAQRLVSALLQARGPDRALQHVERVRVTKETGHADERVDIEGAELLDIAAQEPGVLLRCVVAVEPHPPGDTPPDRAGFVEREIHPGMVAEQAQNRFETVLCRLRGARPGRVLRKASELVRDALRREHEIDTAGGHGAAWHRAVSGRLILRKRSPTLGLDRLQAQCAVGRRAGQNHSDGPLALVRCQGLEKQIDGPMWRARLRPRLQGQHAPGDAQVGVGRNHINVVRLHP